MSTGHGSPRSSVGPVFAARQVIGRPPGSGMILRPHSMADAARIAEILAAGWKQAYSSFMPEAFLAPRIDPQWRRAEIADWLAHDFDPAREAVFVASEGEGERVDGFIHLELGDKGGVGASGIVNLLYVDPARQGRGVGRALMAEGARWLIANRPGALVLSAYADNPWRGFYAALGGREAGRIATAIAGHEVASVLYVWDDPAMLVSA